MKRDILKLIKNDMWETRHSKKDVQSMLKTELAELESRRKEALAEYTLLPSLVLGKGMLCRDPVKRNSAKTLALSEH